MNVGVIPSHGAIFGLIDHLNNVHLGINDVDAVIVEHPQTPIQEGVNYINTSAGLQNFLISEEIQDAFLADMEVDKTAREVSTLYALFNGKNFSDWLEVSFSRRFMNKDVGTQAGFITGAGLVADESIFDAVRGLRALRDFLSKAGYKGEVSVGVSKDLTICSLRFGHFYSYFAMFYEICTNKSNDGVLKFLMGESGECKLLDRIVVANVVSKAPFPYMVKLDQPDISVPTMSDYGKHIWCVKNATSKYLLVVANGEFLEEARRRLRRILYGLVKYDRDLQYRTDFGLRRKFAINQEKYNVLEKKSFFKDK